MRAQPAASQEQSSLPQLSRAVRHGEFLSAVGTRAALLGNEEGEFEAWVYPLKILSGLHLRFHIDGQIVPAEAVARTVVTRPESSTIIYAQGPFEVRETLFVPIHESGAIISLDVHTARPLEIEVAFKPDFQLEWPAVLGGSHLDWDSAANAFSFAVDIRKYAALLGSPTATDPKLPRAVNNSTLDESSFLLGTTTRGTDHKLVFIAASLEGRDDAETTFNRLIHGVAGFKREATDYYRDYLRHTLNIAVPDAEIQQAYDWARISMAQALVDNPLVGKGLIAGYGLSSESERPGFDWFFGRDALWTSLALDAEGDFESVRTALAFLARYQRIDGKIPHEVPQSASLVPWFQDYPYGYASADATPLFLIAMNDYVARSGDVTFANQEWESTWEAYQFLNSTLDADGFAKNIDVGHGWVEGGPLLPVRTEIYQASLGIEAFRAVSNLARLLDKQEVTAGLDRYYEHERNLLNESFWSNEKQSFAFAIDSNNHRADDATVLPAVPMWFGLLDPVKARETIARLAGPDMQSDWGMRILSSSSPKYGSEGYHFGSVWPLFTGWASVGEYRYHRAQPAYANLRQNALLALDGSLGHVTEVLAGDSYRPLPTSTPQQVWSAAMIVNPVLRGLLGLDTDATADTIALTPHVPASWPSVAISNLRVGSAILTLRYHQDAKELRLEMNRVGSCQCKLVFSPALSPRAEVRAATWNGRPIPFRLESNATDTHVSVDLSVPSGKSTLRLRIDDDFGLSIPVRLPAPGGASQGLRIISESWTPEGDRLDLGVAGRPGRDYEFSISNAGRLASVQGAELHAAKGGNGALLVRFPAGSEGYAQRRITLLFMPKRKLPK
jgi:glycogen debranching enzyme